MAGFFISRLSHQVSDEMAMCNYIIWHIKNSVFYHSLQIRAAQALASAEN